MTITHVTPAGRPTVFYISYDGAGEPLGRSQVLAYLKRLASDCDITLISFEKSMSEASGLREELQEAGITWLPLSYHRRPPVLSTLLDVLAGVRVLVRAARARRPDIVHVRSDVPALIAQAGRRFTGGKLIFDIRGFWADERVEGGLWPPGGRLYRLAKRCEQRFYSQADAVVTLTQASTPEIGQWTRPGTPVEVIPTCVDLERFTVQAEREGGPHAVWSGSLGTWYRFDLAARVASALGMPLTVVTRQRELALAELNGYAADVRSLAPELVPQELHPEDIGLCLIKSSYSKVASAPTRFAEYLASGMPVLVTAIGDLEAMVERHGVGVVLRGEAPGDIAEAAEQIRALAADPITRVRCRAVAEQLFDAAAGSRRYLQLYQRLLALTES